MTTPQPLPTSDAAEPAESISAPAESPPERRSIFSAMRAGLLASILCHVVLIMWGIGLWDSARPLAAMPPPSITVDLVSSKDAPSKEVPGDSGQPAAADSEHPTPPEPEKQESLSFPDLLRPSTVLDRPQRAPISPGITMPPDVPPDGIEAKVALANRLAESLQLPVALPGSDYDTTPADASAKLMRDVIAEFKTHLSKCWNAPPRSGNSSRLRVLIRVAFTREGAFLKDPMLIQAVASPSGPGLVKTAMKALQDCQPYAFLPADKYDEWKVIDLAFSPEGIL